MRKLWTAAAAAVCLFTLLHAQPRAQKDDTEAKRVRDAAAIFGEIMAAEDKAIPTAILNKANGIAIFPSTVKAGFIVGGMRGRGSSAARPGGWSSPAFLTLTGGSFGLQIGGQAADIILVINGERGLENLVSNQFKIRRGRLDCGRTGRPRRAGGDRHPAARADPELLARAGTVCRRHHQRQHHPPGPGCKPALLRSALTTRQIVFEGKAGAPDPVGEWRATLAKYAK
jgi:hypothetical protein